MKTINWIINYFTVPGLLVGSVASALMALVLLVAILFNFVPSNAKHSILPAEFSKGIPVSVDVSREKPDFNMSYVVTATANSRQAYFSVTNFLTKKQRFT